MIRERMLNKEHESKIYHKGNTISKRQNPAEAMSCKLCLWLPKLGLNSAHSIGS